MVEPWLRGTLGQYDSVRRQVLHALELAGEDAERWCADLTDEQVNRRPSGIASVAYHLRHIARSLDRLLTYADGLQLGEEQRRALDTELDSGAKAAEVLAEFRTGLHRAMRRIEAMDAGTYEEVRGVGREGLPSSVGGLLVHAAEHTQRHIGQAITTAQVVTQTL